MTDEELKHLLKKFRDTVQEIAEVLWEHGYSLGIQSGRSFIEYLPGETKISFEPRPISLPPASTKFVGQGVAYSRLSGRHLKVQVFRVTTGPLTGELVVWDYSNWHEARGYIIPWLKDENQTNLQDSGRGG